MWYFHIQFRIDLLLGLEITVKVIPSPIQSGVAAGQFSAYVVS
jgi:hypothetical protein